MELWQYLLASIIAGSGLFVGLIVGRIAEEELKKGKPYFIFMQNIVLVLFLFVVLFLKNIALSILVAVIIFALLFKVRQIRNNYLVYAAYAFIFYYTQKAFFITSTLIFLYSIPTGSLLYKKYREISLLFIIFVVVSAVLFLLQQP